MYWERTVRIETKKIARSLSIQNLVLSGFILLISFIIDSKLRAYNEEECECALNEAQYEADPDNFLNGGNTTIHDGQLCFG